MNKTEWSLPSWSTNSTWRGSVNKSSQTHIRLEPVGNDTKEEVTLYVEILKAIKLEEMEFSTELEKSHCSHNAVGKVRSGGR